MIRALYALLGKLVYWISTPLLFLISLRAQPRVRVIAVDNQGRILLVRNWFGRQHWTLPGGGVKWHEPPVKAAQRELLEELSLDISEDDLTPVGSFEKYDTATPFRINLFSVELVSERIIHRHPFEILDAVWAEPDKLPKPLHPSVERSLKLWRP